MLETTSVFLMDGTPPTCNIMIDLETWGTRPGSAIRSIGAVSFDPFSDTVGGTFYRNINGEGLRDAGFTYDAETVSWWAQQSQQAKDAFKVDPQPIKQVVMDFNDWFKTQRGMFIWSHGANFDEPLWTEACRLLGLKWSWKFWDVRCTRTLYSVANFNPKSIKRDGTHHNALDDALYQVRCVQAAYARMDQYAEKL